MSIKLMFAIRFVLPRSSAMLWRIEGCTKVTKTTAPSPESEKKLSFLHIFLPKPFWFEIKVLHLRRMWENP